MIREIPGIEQVTLTTNGILLKDKINELVSNGLDTVNISIDSPDPDRYEKITRGGRLEEALAGLEAALSCTGLGVRVNCVPMQETPSEDIIGLASLAKDRELDVRFIEMMPIGLGKNFGMISGSRIRDLLEERFGSAGLCSENVETGRQFMCVSRALKGGLGLSTPCPISSAVHATGSG